MVCANCWKQSKQPQSAESARPFLQSGSGVNESSTTTLEVVVCPIKQRLKVPSWSVCSTDVNSGMPYLLQTLQSSVKATVFHNSHNVWAIKLMADQLPTSIILRMVFRRLGFARPPTFTSASTLKFSKRTSTCDISMPALHSTATRACLAFKPALSYHPSIAMRMSTMHLQRMLCVTSSIVPTMFV